MYVWVFKYMMALVDDCKWLTFKSLDHVAFYEAFIPFESVSIEKNRRSETDRVGLLKIHLTDFSGCIREYFSWFLFTISWAFRQVCGSVGNLVTSSIASQTLKRVDPVPSIPFSFFAQLAGNAFWLLKSTQPLYYITMYCTVLSCTNKETNDMLWMIPRTNLRTLPWKHPDLIIRLNACSKQNCHRRERYGNGQ
jgi:hypothetical protein